MERAEAWDKHQAELEKEAFEKEKQRRRARRQKILEDGFVKLEQMIKNVPVKKLSLHQISVYMDILMRHERMDYDDEPSQRMVFGDEEGKGVPIVHFTIQKVEARDPPLTPPVHRGSNVASDAGGDADASNNQS